MASRCDICQKSPAAGKTVSHSHKASNRRFLPNVRKVQLVLNGRVQRAKVCTRCLRTQKIQKPTKRKVAA